MDEEKSRPLYMISVISNMFEIHPQTLRLYEREGLLIPSRSSGHTRMYSKEDVERLEMILRLTRDLGINLAGVSAVMKLKRQVEEHDARQQALLDRLQEEFKDEPDTLRRVLDILKSEI